MRVALSIVLVSGITLLNTTFADAHSLESSGRAPTASAPPMRSSADAQDAAQNSPYTGQSQLRLYLDGMEVKLEELQAQINTLAQSAVYAGAEPGLDEIPTGG